MPKMKEETIKLYEEKVAWAKTQDPSENPSKGDMLQQIGHSWNGKFCPYCKKYGGKNDCIDCPLRTVNVSCCNGLWIKMDYSKTWGGWIYNAEKVLEYIMVNG